MVKRDKCDTCGVPFSEDSIGGGRCTNCGAIIFEKKLIKKLKKTQEKKKTMPKKTKKAMLKMLNKTKKMNEKGD
jgi:hypothetical protein